MKNYTAKMLLIVCMLIPNYCFAQELAHRDEALGIGFPSSIGSLKFETVQTYNNPALGYSVRYGGADLTKADLYIYDKGIRNLSDGIASEPIKKEMREVVYAFFEFERIGRYKDVKKTEEAVFTVKSGPTPIEYLWARCTYRQNPGEGVAYHGPRISETFLTARGGKFIKVRLTYIESIKDAGEKLARTFVEELSSLIRK